MDIASLKQSLNEYKYKIELHAHTSPMSPCSQITPKKMIEAYKESGYSGVVITNHFFDSDFLDLSDLKKAEQKYLKDYYDTKNEGEKHSVNVYLGLEARFPQNNNDYLVYGIDQSDILPALRLLKTDIETFYKEFKNDKNVIMQAHPFRQGSEPANINFVDGVEAFNMHPNHNSRVGIAAKFAKENNLKICGGSDYHHDGQHAMCAVCAKTLPTDSFGVAELIKSQDFLIKLGKSLILP